MVTKARLLLSIVEGDTVMGWVSPDAANYFPANTDLKNTTPGQTIKCNNCKYLIKINSKFCPKCKQKLKR